MSYDLGSIVLHVGPPRPQLTAVSLFAGVGGFDLALERAGVKVCAAVEIDKHARGVLARHFSDTQLFNDVTTVTGQELRDAGFIPEHGIITGGFPCQDLSVAGKRAGLAGARSGLFWEIVRLLEELTPKYVILENVPGLLTSNQGRDFGIVLSALDELGYGLAWRVLDAQNFGVPQRRRRVFIVGCFGDGERAAEILALTESLRGDSEASDSTGEEVATEFGVGFEGGGGGIATALQRGGRINADETYVVAERERESRHDWADFRGEELQQPTGSPTGKPSGRLYGQTGYARYSEGQVKTLSATDYKRAEDNVVVCEGGEVGGQGRGGQPAARGLATGGGLSDLERNG